MKAGSITFSTALDNAQLEKQLSQLTRKIEKREREIAGLTAKRDAAQQKGVFDAAVLDEEKGKLQEIRDRLDELRNRARDKGLSLDAREGAKALLPSVQQELADQQIRVRGLQAEWNKTENAVDRYNAKISEAEGELNRQKTEAGELTQRLESAKTASGALAGALARANDQMRRFLGRVKNLATRVFVFTLITSALRSIRTWLWNSIKTSGEATQAIARLKGALLTMAQPLIEVIIPAFTLLVNVLTRVVTVVARLVSALFGKTLQQSRDNAKALYEQANATKAVGEAAEEAAGSLAGFDEINTIGSTGGEDSGGGQGGNIAPDFNFDTGKYKDMLDELMVYLSGAALAIGAILFFSGANIPLGLGLMVLGAAGLAEAVMENWGAADGRIRDAVNRVLVILGGALLVIGAILAFSGAHLPLGIGLMVVGAAMLASAAALNWNSMSPALQGALTALLVILGGALIVIGAVLAFSGANIPLGIALILLGAASLATAGALNWNALGEELRGALSALLLIIGGFLLVLGALLVFSGANIPLGIGLIILGAAALAAAAALDWENVSGRIQHILAALLAVLGGALLVLGAVLAFSGANIPLGLGLMALGAAALAAAAALDWDNVSSRIQDILSELLLALGSALLVLGALLAFSGTNIPLGLGLLALGAAALAAAAALDWDNVSSRIQDILSELLLALGSALLVLGALLAFSGTNIPLGLGLLALGAAALAAGAALNWEEVSGQIRTAVSVLTGILSVAFLALGAVLAFSGANIPLGIALLVLGTAGVGLAKLNWDAISTALQGPIGKVTAIASAALLALGVIICFSGVGLPLGIALIFAGAAGLVTVTALNWNALQDKLGETWRGIKSWWDQNVAKYLTLEYWKGKGGDIIDGFKKGISDAWDGLKTWFNNLWDSLFGKKDVSVNVSAASNSSTSRSSRTVNTGGISAYSLPDISGFDVPALARGAVIPPNREFLAILGDQRSGTNIEAPLATIEQAVENVMNRMGMAGEQTIEVTLMIDKQKLGRVMVPVYNGMARAKGKPVFFS